MRLLSAFSVATAAVAALLVAGCAPREDAPPALQAPLFDNLGTRAEAPADRLARLCPERDTWFTCRRTSICASAATLTRRLPTSGPRRPTRPKTAEADDVHRQFERAWALADVELATSRF